MEGITDAMKQYAIGIGNRIYISTALPAMICIWIILQEATFLPEFSWQLDGPHHSELSAFRIG